VLFPALLSLGTLTMVYLIGRKTVGPLAAVCAAALYTLFPADIYYGTMLMPDTIVPFYLSTAVYTFLEAETADTKHNRWLYLLSGFMVFLAFNCRENSYYFALFYLPYVFSRERWQRGLWCVPAGFLAPVLLLYSFYMIKTGDFLYNLHLAQKARDPLIESGYIPENKILWIANFYFMFPGLFWKITGKPGFIDPLFGLTFTFGVPLLIAATIAAKRKKTTTFLIIPWWFLSGYLYHEFGSISFSSYQMMKKLPRFLLVLTPPIAISCGYLTGMFISWLTRRWRKQKSSPVPYVAGAFLIAILVGMVYVFWGVFALTKYAEANEMNVYRWAAYDVLKNRPRKPVYQTGGWWRNKLSFYLLPDERFVDLSWKRSGLIRDLMAVDDPASLGGSYVIIDRSHFTGQNSLKVAHSYASFGGYMVYPPPEWNNLGTEYGVEIYEVPDRWVYIEPEGKELALNGFHHAIETGDLMLAIFVMHPDFVNSFNGQTFRTFIDTISDEDNPQSRQLYETVTYQEYNGRWKLVFHPETGQ